MDQLAELEKQTKHGSVVLTAGNANAFAFAWENPNPFAIVLFTEIIRITTAGGTAGAILDVGPAVDATTHGDTIFNEAPIDVISDLRSVEVIRLDAKGGTTSWITGQILTQNAASLAGKAYFMYVKE